MAPLIPKTPNINGMDIALDFNNMMAEQVGETHGIAVEDMEKLAHDIQKPDGFHDRFHAKRAAGEMGFADLPYDAETIGRIKELAEWVRDRFENFVVLGIGGSALGAVALHRSLAPFYYNLLEPADRGGCPRMFFCDNIDPVQISALMRVANPEQTVFNVISKSGSTAETMAQFLVIRDMLVGALGAEKMKEHLIITTDPKTGDLRSLCNRDDYEGLSIPANVGGRYSCLTAVGLFPAAVSGIDIDGVIGGARSMDQRCKRRSLWENPAYLGATLAYLANQKRNKHVQVFMPYSESLAALGDWFCQLHAESLGKMNLGQTPVRARGVSDQHSQLQLYLEGPNDKMFTLVHLARFNEKLAIPKVPAYESYQSVNYLGGHSMEELLHAERLATESALTRHERPNLTIHVPALCAETVGQLLYQMEMQTAFAGLLYGINPFDQPAVELGKKLTYHLMGRPGFERRPHELLEADKKQNRYMT